jgi:hypothetical protein
MKQGVMPIDLIQGDRTFAFEIQGDLAFRGDGHDSDNRHAVSGVDNGGTYDVFVRVFPLCHQDIEGQL